MKVFCRCLGSWSNSFSGISSKLGVKPAVFRQIVETERLAEWSADSAFTLAQKHCSWIVEEAAEDLESE